MIDSMNARAVLANGVRMPWVGLGMWKVPSEEAAAPVAGALRMGYRLVDTAAVYRNEDGIGEGLRQSGIPREQLFITTKLWNEDIRRDRVAQAFEESLQRLGLDHVDLYLMHWPVPDKFAEAWQQMLRIYESGRARAIGVCNCAVHHLEELERSSGVRPMVNQVERHPLLSQQPMRRYCREHGILLQAYSPLMQGRLDQPLFTELAAKYGRTPAQVILRWHLQQGVAVIPKSVHAQRQRQNMDLFGFTLTPDDMDRIDAFNQDRRFCADPDHFDF